MVDKIVPSTNNKIADLPFPLVKRNKILYSYVVCTFIKDYFLLLNKKRVVRMYL
jgi:hypothetical protein